MPDYIGNIEMPSAALLGTAKVCSKCGVRKLLSEFSRNRALPDGRRPECRQCQREHHREYYLRTRVLKGTKSGAPALDLTGQRFGRLIAVRRVHNDKQGKAQWLCLCDCGRETVVRRCSLRLKNPTQSCGCLAIEVAREIVKRMQRKCGRDYPPGEAAKRDVLREYKRAAKARRYEWELTDGQALNLMKSRCHYCGREPSTERSISSNGSFLYNGLDRKDNRKGYSTENTVPCCPICNRAKMDAPYDEFIAWARRIAEVHS